MAKTDAELLAHFRQKLGKNYSLDEFMSARKYGHDFFEKFEVYTQFLPDMSTMSEANLNAARTMLTDLLAKINAEVSRRAV